ncbi:hypothetical protein [Rubrivirga sp. IMCC43871]|uniref:hypothetical protein n=1 Tax=Rubrivirga sp. IMCC43871 TaxID=3391575 RepID=UPI00399029B9
MADPIYTPDDVAAIIARTAERQRDATEPSGSQGLTLAEVERACREAGLDPALVRQAAAELDAGRLRPSGGSAATSVAEHWVDGLATAEGWQDAFDHLRVRFGRSVALGTAAEMRRVGEGWEWTHQTLRGLRRTVSVSPRAGRTRVRVVTVDSGFANERVHGRAIGGLFGLVAVFLLGGLLSVGFGLTDLAVQVPLALALVTAVGMGGLIVAPRIRRRREQQARDGQDLAEEVGQWTTAAPLAHATEPAPIDAHAGGASAAPASEPLLRLDLDEPAEAEAPSAHRTRVR